MSKPVFDHVSAERLWSRIQKLAEFGATPDGGVDRPALSEEESQARAQLVTWGRSIGLAPFTDEIGNLFMRLEGRNPKLPPVLAGSHIDSQPSGGRFDGVFGVLAALETLEAMVASGQSPLRPIEVVAWTNEEGSRFAPGMNGSTAFCFPERLPDILQICDAQGTSVEEAVRLIKERDDNIPQRALGRQVASFVEAHIEQGPLLEQRGIPLGVVTGIQGTRRYRVRLIGKAAHAGTEPMADRADALLAAVEIINLMRQAASVDPEFKFTVGMLQILPNAPSVVPCEAFFSIDIRHQDDMLVDTVDARFREIVNTHNSHCSVELKQIAKADSLTFPETIRAAISAAAEYVHVDKMVIYSAAGHDARQLHAVCPTGMIFIPCKEGKSHTPEESAEPDHLFHGTRVLAQTLVALSSG